MPSDSISKTLALRELYNKLENNYKIVESYRPNTKISPITTKFYARHESADLTKADEELMHHIFYMKKDLKEKVSKPDTVNHSYGWYCNPIVPLNRNDRRFYAPLVSNDSTKTMIALNNDQSLKRKKFQGVPFKL